MKSALPTKYKITLLTCLLFLLMDFLNINKSYGQIDYNYQRNNSGLRLGAGVGLATLITHFSSNPAKGVAIGSLDYDFSPYLSVGLEGQYGTLQGIDQVHHLPYYSSTDTYLQGNFNVKVAVGLFDDFYSENGLQDAIKRIYIGAGFGQIKTNITFVDNPDREFTKYGSVVPKGRFWCFPFNIGTTIELPGVLGYDRLSVNPNFQFNYVNSLYLDGFQSSQYSYLKGFYNLTSIKLKFKF